MASYPEKRKWEQRVSSRIMSKVAPGHGACSAGSATEWLDDIDVSRGKLQGAQDGRRSNVASAHDALLHTQELELGGTDCSNLSAEGGCSADIAVRRAKGVGQMWYILSTLASMFALCCIATAPRFVSLLSIGWLVPLAPMPAALDNFTAVWAPCKDPGNLFTAISPDGELYKWLATSNNALSWAGSAIVCSCAGQTWMAVEDWKKGTKSRLFFLSLQHLFNALIMASAVFPITGHVAFHLPKWAGSGTERDVTMKKMHPGSMQRRPEALRQPDLSTGYALDLQYGILLPAFCLVSSAARFSIRRWGSWQPLWDWHQLRVRSPGVLIYSLALLASWTYFNDITDSFASLQAMDIIWPVLICKACISLLRFAQLRNLSWFSSTVLLFNNGLAGYLDLITSIHVRVKGWGHMSTSSDLWGVIAVSMLINTVEAVVVMVSCYINLLRSHRQYFQGVNSKTLDGLLESHTLYQRNMEVVYGQLFTSTFAEISACVVIAAADIAAPVWNRHSTWTTYHVGPKICGALASLLVQLFIQVSTIPHFFRCDLSSGFLAPSECVF